MNMFSDIDRVWKGKRVEFVAGDHNGKSGVCDGFYNTYGGAGLRIVCDSGEIVMVYPRYLENIKIIKESTKNTEVMKTFEDLNFEPHALSEHAESLPESIRDNYANAKQATLEFENGYGISVIIGGCFYSNGIDTYEVAVMKDDRICYDTPITDDVIGRITSAEVTEVMKKVQELNN